LKPHLANFRFYVELNYTYRGQFPVFSNIRKNWDLTSIFQKTVVAIASSNGQDNTGSRASRRMLFDFIENRLGAYLQNEQARGHDWHIGLEET